MPEPIIVKPVADGARLKEIMMNPENNVSKLLVLEFMAPWSEPCKYMSKVLDGNPPGNGLANELKDDADFYALDIATFRQFAQRMTVEALPTFLLLKGCTVLGSVVGVDKEELRSSIKKHKDKAAGTGVKTVVKEEDLIDKPPSLLTSPVAFLMTKLRSFFF